MASRYLGEIRIFAGDYAPAGWALCDGRKLQIGEYEDTLFKLLGASYGGDGVSTFGVPDLRGRIPIHAGTNPETGTKYERGSAGGVPESALTVEHLPDHTHAALALSNDATLESPANAFWAKPGAVLQYSPGAADRDMNPDAIKPAGGNKPHGNLMPYLAINFIIALDGLPPTAHDREASLAEIRMFPHDAIPPGWERCDGQELGIADNQALFSIMGNRFGGNDVTTFKLPDLRGRAPVHPGEDVSFAQGGGEERHALTLAEMPAHTHPVFAQGKNGKLGFPAHPKDETGYVWAYEAAPNEPFASAANSRLHPSAISSAGQGLPHENMQPYRVLVYCIATRGIFPMQP